jgi:hypothetical protein
MKSYTCFNRRMTRNTLKPSTYKKFGGEKKLIEKVKCLFKTNWIFISQNELFECHWDSWNVSKDATFQKDIDYWNLEKQTYGSWDTTLASHCRGVVLVASSPPPSN